MLSTVFNYLTLSRFNKLLLAFIRAIQVCLQGAKQSQVKWIQDIENSLVDCYWMQLVICVQCMKYTWFLLWAGELNCNYFEWPLRAASCEPSGPGVFLEIIKLQSKHQERSGEPRSISMAELKDRVLQLQRLKISDPIFFLRLSNLHTAKKY